MAAVSLVLVAVFALVLTSVALPARADDEATEQARKHYLKGKQEFDLGEWDRAIVEFEEAYKLHPDSSFLFNMAQAYRRKGDLQHALDLYKNYLIGNPESPKRDEIEGRIRMLEREMKRRQAVSPGARPSEPPPTPPLAVAPSPPPVPTPAAPVAVVPLPVPTVAQQPATPMPHSTPAITAVQTSGSGSAPEPAASGHGLRVAGIVCGAAGLASLGTAVYFYSRAVALSSSVSNSDAPDADYRAGKNAETMQWIFYSVGAGALVTGAILYYLGWRAPAASPTASVAPLIGAGVAGVSARGTF